MRAAVTARLGMSAVMTPAPTEGIEQAAKSFCPAPMRQSS
jgi:hypothetical protein